MKLWKKLATLAMALTLCVGVGAALTACGKDKDNSSSSSLEQTQTSSYEFKVVLKDGTTPAVGYKIQLCEKLANGELGSCESPVDVGADGTLTYEVTDTSKKYEIHVMEGNKPLDATQFVTTGDIPANYDGGVITVTINK